MYYILYLKYIFLNYKYIIIILYFVYLTSPVFLCYWVRIITVI